MEGPIDIRPLSAPFGAEITGFDPRLVTDPDATRAWHAALERHQLVVFRELDLEATEQVALVETLGPPLVENDSGRSWQYVSNTHEDGILGDERFAFHSDHAFMVEPIEVISLYGLEIPSAGTPTRFVSAEAAARELPEGLRKRVGARSARHIIDPAAASGDVAVRGPTRPDRLPHAWHPVLWPAGRSGEPILYVSEQQTDLVDGLTDPASRELIEALFEHLYSGAFEYNHEWRKRDLVVWDNRALQHARGAIPEGASRNLRRVSVGGTPVHDYFRPHAKWGLDEDGSGPVDASAS